MDKEYRDYIMYHLDMLGIYLSRDDLDLLVNVSMAINRDLWRVIRLKFPDIKLIVTEQDLNKNFEILDNISKLTAVVDELMNSNYLNDNATENVDIDEFDKLNYLLNNNTIEVDCYKTTSSVLLFLDRSLLLNLNTFLNRVLISDNNIDLIEKKEIVTNTVKLFLSTLDKCGDGERDISQRSRQFKHLSLIYLKLLDMA